MRGRGRGGAGAGLSFFMPGCERSVICCWLRTVCVQFLVADDPCATKPWHCFEGNLEDTAERRGGARMGLSERHNAVLSRD